MLAGGDRKVYSSNKVCGDKREASLQVSDALLRIRSVWGFAGAKRNRETFNARER